MQKEKVIVIGSGPAGLTAALYTARANLEPLVFAGSQLGGQVSITHEVENYPGFPDGLSGPELVERMTEQAKRFGARVEYNEVAQADFSKGSPFYLKDGSGKEYEADSVIVTSGATPRRLGIPGEEEFIGRGVSYCGTCDGFFFKGKHIIVVGGGDSAIEEGIFLTRFAKTVTVIHRRDELRAGPTLKDRAFNNEKISFIWDTLVEEIGGSEDEGVRHVQLRNLKTDEVTEFDTEGVFIFIGHDPNNQFFDSQLTMKDGYIVVDERMMTNIPGVFAAGEIMDPLYRQVATSVGQGSAAGMMAEQWISEHENAPTPA
jgi:thioredoxin reductase (NADPH)